MKNAGNLVKSPDFLSSVITALPKIRTPIQLIGLIVAIGAFLAIRSVFPAALNAQISAGAIGLCFVVFPMLFVTIPQLPEKQRGFCVIAMFGMFLTFVIALIIVIGRSIGGAQPPPVYTGDEDRVIQAKHSLDALKGTYETLKQYPNLTGEVNDKAIKLAQDFAVAADANLDTARKIMKYEYKGYVLAIAAYTDSRNEDKLKHAQESLEDLAKATAIVNELKNSGEDQSVVTWIIHDDTEARITFVSAVDFCIQAQLQGRGSQINLVKNTLSHLPASYRDKFPPEKTIALDPCLSSITGGKAAGKRHSK
jgi:hypothetical protein